MGKFNGDEKDRVGFEIKIIEIIKYGIGEDGKLNRELPFPLLGAKET